jgi:hypothetical protein
MAIFYQKKELIAAQLGHVLKNPQSPEACSMAVTSVPSSPQMASLSKTCTKTAGSHYLRGLK